MSNAGETTPRPADEGRGVLHIGVDLGTSRTSVSASNGVRETVLSFVGYPKDVVSQKLLKKEKLFGQEARDHRLSLRFYRPLEHGVIKGSAKRNGDADYAENLAAAKDLVRHALEMVGPRKDQLLYGVIGAPAQASINNKEAIIEAAREALDSVMLCSEPFAVAYGLDRLEDVLVIDIGAGTTDLARVYGVMPSAEDQITLNQAGDFIDQTLHDLMRQKCAGADFNLHMVKAIKEKHSFVGEAVRPVIAHLPVRGKPTSFDITDEVRRACRAIIPPIVDAIGQLIASFDPEFQERLRNNVLLGGGGSQIVGLGPALEEALKETCGGGRVSVVEEPIYAGANGALKIARDMPAEYWQKLR
jgi:rod shape-determining protein MreB and related proteins